MKSSLRDTIESLRKLDLDPVIVSCKNHAKVRISHPNDRTIAVTLTFGVTESDRRSVKNTEARVKRFIKTGAI